MPDKSIKIPQVDKVLNHQRLKSLANELRRDVLANLCRRELHALRQTIFGNKNGSPSESDKSLEADKEAEYSSKINDDESENLSSDNSLDAIAERIYLKAIRLREPGLRKVINGTGVILNTNLGRAPLPAGIGERLKEIAAGYTNLELNLETGKRGERGTKLEELLQVLTGCERAVVVNNNAASVMLTVAALSNGKEVIVSRGELIEIGGSFRLPDVIEAAGGCLREIGTTNRTRISDYKNAVSEKTGLILKCHRSNFEISGFTEEATLEELVALGSSAGIPVVEDLGSGALVDLQSHGLANEPTVPASIDAGICAVMFSCDKLLGGPQSGIIAGKSHVIEKLRRHSIYRALRADKLTIAFLEEVLSLYLLNDPQNNIPALKMSFDSADFIRSRVEKFIDKYAKQVSNLVFEASQCESTFGGGTNPGKTQPSYALTVRAKDAPKSHASKFSSFLRGAEIPVIGVIREDVLLLDFRTIFEDDQESLFSALKLLDESL